MKKLFTKKSTMKATRFSFDKYSSIELKSNSVRTLLEENALSLTKAAKSCGECFGAYCISYQLSFMKTPLTLLPDLILAAALKRTNVGYLLIWYLPQFIVGC